MQAPLYAQTVASPRAERITGLELRRTGDDSPLDDRHVGLEAIEFTAYGRNFVLDLQSNDRIKSRMQPIQQARLSHVRLYRGSLADYQGSWVRIAETDGRISGVFSDGAALYVIEPVGTQLTVYRPEDVPELFGGSLAGDIVALASTGDGKPDSGGTAPGAKLDLPVDPGRTIAIGLVADAPFADERTDATADLLSIMNIVEGIYLWQLGVQLDVAEIVLLDDTDDPFRSAGAAEFLSRLLTYKGGSPALAPLGLVHLFTGHEIDDQNGNPVGAATIGSVCDTTLGVSITESRNGIFLEALIAAHEMAHNFGAMHDNQGGPCASTPGGFLMEARVNGSQTFSQCSIDQMVPLIESRSCFEPWLPNDLSLRVVDGPIEIYGGNEEPLIVAIDAGGVGSANAVELVVEASGGVELRFVGERSVSDAGFRCDNFSQPRRCAVNFVPQGSSPEFEIGLGATESGAGEITVIVNAGNDPNPDNDTLIYPVTVPLAADLQTSIEFLPGQSRVAGDLVLYPGEIVALSSTVKNLSSTAASDVEALVEFDEQASDYQVSGADVSCEPDTEPHWIRCALGDLATGEERRLDLSFMTQDSIDETRGVSTNTISVDATAEELDLDLIDNIRYDSVTVANAVFDLAFEVSAPDGSIEVGVPTDIVLSLRNLGPDPARFVGIETYHLATPPPSLEFTSATSNVGTCALNPSNGQLNCELETLGAGESFDATISITASEDLTFDFWTGYRRAGYEVGGYEGGDHVQLVVGSGVPPNPPPPPTPPPTTPPTNPPPAAQSGGGGAMDWLTVLILLPVGRWLIPRLASLAARSRPAHGPDCLLRATSTISNCCDWRLFVVSVRHAFVTGAPGEAGSPEAPRAAPTRSERGIRGNASSG